MDRMPETPETTGLELMRLLHGEMPAEQARLLRGRLEREPELAAAWARLETTWSGLDLPPAAPAPHGFSQRVARRAAGTGDQNGLSWSAAPVWVRAAAAAALATGLVLGAGAGSWAGKAEPGTADSAAVATAQSASDKDADDAETSLAESYWDSLGDPL